MLAPPDLDAILDEADDGGEDDNTLVFAFPSKEAARHFLMQAIALGLIARPDSFTLN